MKLNFSLLVFIFLLSQDLTVYSQQIPSHGNGLGKETKIDVSNTSKTIDSAVYKYVEVLPEFPNGEEALLNYIATNVRYPKKARRKSIEGKVLASFIIDKEGHVKDVKIIRGIGFGCDEEVVRVLEAMPNWKPGMQGGKLVSCQYNLPVQFALE